jgi:hypothetical protein
MIVPAAARMPARDGPGSNAHVATTHAHRTAPPRDPTTDARGAFARNRSEPEDTASWPTASK